MSLSDSDSSSSKVDAKRESRIADEKGLWVLKGDEEKEALRVGTDWGRGLRPDAKRPPQAPDEAPPPELLRTGWSGGATKFWERGGWDAARSRRLRLVGVSEPWDERKRFWRSESSEGFGEWLVCGMEDVKGKPRLRRSS